MRKLALAIAFTVVSAPTISYSEKLSKDQQAAIAKSPAEIADLAQVRNDPLDTVISIDTSKFYSQKDGILKIVNNDKFMRALIDKKTGTTVFQVYLMTRYAGDWRFFDRVNYLGPNGPESANVHQISRSVAGCSQFGCLHEEHIAADIPEEVLKRVAAEAVAGADSSWHIKVFGRSADGVTTGVLKTEVAGLLLAVERERTKMKTLR